MSRKDFELIAGIIHGMNEKYLHDAIIQNIAIEFSQKLAITNPLFDQKRFLTACGV